MTPHAPAETWHFDTARVGRRVLVFDSVGSTNAVAAELADSAENDGLVLVARHQTAGRGQHGRVWAARPGSSLLMSVVLHPPAELRRPVMLTAWAAVAVADAVFDLSGAQARIKWPNDLLVRGKKVCGILIEQASGGSGTTPRTVAGVGLNLSQTAEEFAAAGLPHATSVAMIGGPPAELRAAAEVVVRRLDMEYARLLDGERVAVEADWKWRVGLLGREVVAELSDGSRVEGRLRDMGFDGVELDTPGGVRVLLPEAVAHVWAG